MCARKDDGTYICTLVKCCSFILSTALVYKVYIYCGEPDAALLNMCHMWSISPIFMKNDNFTTSYAETLFTNESDKTALLLLV